MFKQQDLKNTSFKTSLTYLIYCGHFSQARLLIESSECDLNETDEVWIHKYPKLIRNRKSVTSSLPLISYKGTLCGRTALMLCCMIEDDSWSYSLAQNLIEKGAKLGLKDSYGYNAFMYACLYEKPRIIELFFNSPGDFSLYSKEQFGNTCFHLTGLTKDDTLCNLLRRIVIKFNQTQTIGRNKYNHSPIDLCRLNGHETCVKLELLKTSNLSRRDHVSTETLRVHFAEPESEESVVQEIEPRTRLTPRTNIFSYNENWLEFYKFIKNIKEPLIKEFKDKNPLDKVINDYIEFKNVKSNQKCVITRNLVSQSEHYDLIKRERERAVSDSRIKFSRMGSKITNTNEIDYNKPWRHNLKNLYETFEFQNTRSFRRTMNQSPSNLFDQLATGLLLNLHINNCLNDSRRSSGAKNPRTSQTQFSLSNQQLGASAKTPKSTNASSVSQLPGSSLGQHVNLSRRTSNVSIK